MGTVGFPVKASLVALGLLGGLVVAYNALWYSVLASGWIGQGCAQHPFALGNPGGPTGFFTSKETALAGLALLVPVLLVVGDFQRRDGGRPQCANCGRGLEPGWQACPYCATPLGESVRQ